jgi:hypothetical protein
MPRKKLRKEGAWLDFNVTSPTGYVWSFWKSGKRIYVRYGRTQNGRTTSTGHWLSEDETRLVAALEMNRAAGKPHTAHEVVCVIVRNDMKHWRENKTKNVFRNIVRPKE